MAKMIPNSFLDTGSEGEQRIFESLSNLLPDDYIVFHSLRWIGSNRRRSQGEADFVIFNPQKGILVLEVKAGLIKLEDRIWYQTNRNTGQTFEIFDPEKQADESKFRLIELLKIRNCLVCHAVWFPSLKFNTRNLPPNYNSSILLDSDDLFDPQQGIDKAFLYWSNQTSISTELKSSEVTKIISKLAPNFSLVPSLESDYRDREQKFVQLTNEQVKILDFLEMQNVAAIAGSAGTGKTLIAIEKARRLCNDGKKVLFVCYNRLLSDYLTDQYSHYGFDINNFDRLAIKYAGNHSSFEENHRRFLDYLLDENCSFPYTDIIIDEGQDFKNDWIEYLQYRINVDSNFYVFYDQNQCLYSSDLNKWLKETPCRLTLTTNCRNTISIAKTAYGCLGSRSKQPNLSGIEGDVTELIVSTESNDLANTFNKKVNDIIHKARQNYSDIAILTMTSKNNSILPKFKSKIHFPTSEKLNGNSVITTTAKKFKGLEANVVFILDIDWNNLEDSTYRNLFYTTCARAKHQLFIISAPLSQLDYDTILSYTQDPSSKRKGKRRFLKLFNLSEK